MDGSRLYMRQKANGYNVFYNCGTKFYDRGTSPATYDQSASTDSTSDPQFMNAANGDFRLKPTSPCLNTGKPTLGGGYTSIGAWQRKSLLR
jgi:hypothetical protein